MPVQQLSAREREQGQVVQRRHRLQASSRASWHEGRRVFVHYSEITGGGFKSLAEGESVEFVVVEGKKGLAASQVTKVA